VHRAVPAALAPILRRDLLDEAVLSEETQVVAARRRALADLGSALRRRRVAREL